MAGYYVYRGDGLIFNRNERFDSINLEIVLLFPKEKSNDFFVQVTYYIIDDWNNLERGFVINKNDLFALALKTKEWHNIAVTKNIKEDFAKDIFDSQIAVYNKDQMGRYEDTIMNIGFVFHTIYSPENNEQLGLLTNKYNYNDPYVKLDTLAFDMDIVDEIISTLNKEQVTIIYNKYLNKCKEEKEYHKKIDNLFT